MLICLSASHKNSSFDVLEKLSVGATTAASGMLERHDALSGAVVVATCNRFEAYLDLDEPFGVSPLPAVYAAIDAVSASTGVDADILRNTLDFVHGNSVPEHLFSVTSGLESVVVGEGEIAGQVRRALEQARESGTTSPELERLFQRASRTSRGVKNRTGIGTVGRSLVRLSLELAESRIDDWTNLPVLLIGTGRYAGASLAALRDRGAANVRVYSPSGRAEKFAVGHDIEAVAEADFSHAVGNAELIVTCTTVEHHVITADVLRAGRALVAPAPIVAEPVEVRTCPVTGNAGTVSTINTVSELSASSDLMTAQQDSSPADIETTGRRQLIIDLGLPRNVDPDVVAVDGIELLDLETIRLHAPIEELNATSDARKLVTLAARKFTSVSKEQSLAPAVVALRSHVFDILDAEIERARKRGDDTEHTESALRHLASVLLHTPMVRSRELAGAGDHDAFIGGLNALFGIAVELPAAEIDAVPSTDVQTTAS
ncbi:glutamyl-tRNA reductase [Leifsonia sp. A12D58]|uniref:glutamyl-tRNA reductase n=1 Tax=Leifsonia sp. A12D58 TaxID=3397674 RepID=UPI0039E1AA73